MTQATRVGELGFSDYLQRGIREGAMWALICVAVYLVLALASYSPQDPGWSHVGHGELVGNAGGRAGAWFSDVALYLFGFLAYLIPVMVAWSGYLVFRKPEPEPETRLHKLALRWFGFLFTLAAGCAFASIHLPGIGADLPNGTGGGLGLLIGERMIQAFSEKGATLFLVGLFLAGFRLFTGVSWLSVLDGLGGSMLTLFRWVRDGLGALRPRRLIGQSEPQPSEPVLLEAPDVAEPFHPEPISEASTVQETPWEVGQLVDKPAKSKKQKAALAPASKKEQQMQIPQFLGDGESPPLELLDPPRKSGKGYTKEMLEELSRQVEIKLADFGVAVEVVAVLPGPVVTLFELQLAPGTKVSKITGLSKDHGPGAVT